MYKEDIELAKKARFNAYSPYGNYYVGACLRCKDGTTYLGCNIENHGLQSLCAERTAFVKALSDGKREFSSIAIVSAPAGVFVFEDNGKIETLTLADLLPYPFEF